MPERTSARVVVDQRLLPERFLVVSNRLPYQVDSSEGSVRSTRGVGGLVTALDPILRLTGGTWIGWSGTYDELPDKIPVEGAADGKDYSLRPVRLSEAEVEGYYLGYANKGLWPLFHYFQEHTEYNREQWNVYKEVNQRFADHVIDEYRPGDLIWIHDFHLMLVPGMVRRAIPDARIGFFLHIPFPGNELFMVDPHAEILLSGVLGADQIGFHIDGYARNFIDSVATITDHRYSRGDMRVRMDGRSIRIGSYPISIDFDEFAERASSDAVPARVEELRNGYRADIIALGVDRLDYSKGIFERLRAIEEMLDSHPELQGRFTFVQVSAPSRTKVAAYQDMREKIEQMVGRINGRFGARGCIPIDYRYESMSQQELAAYYRASEVALVTPLRDGMNLVAKEYVASQVDNHGALVLSRFTGAYEELRDALIVNPYDIESTAETIYDAIMMPKDQKEARMRRMREVVRRNDIYWWLERVLRDLL